MEYLVSFNPNPQLNLSEIVVRWNERHSQKVGQAILYDATRVEVMGVDQELLNGIVVITRDILVGVTTKVLADLMLEVLKEGFQAKKDINKQHNKLTKIVVRVKNLDGGEVTTVEIKE